MWPPIFCHFLSFAPWLANVIHSNKSMSQPPNQLRLLSSDPNPLLQASNLGLICTSNQIKLTGFFSPQHNQKLVYFEFDSSQDKENVLLMDNLIQNLTDLNFQLPSSENINIHNYNHRTIFINNIDICNFNLFTLKTLDQRLNEIISVIKNTDEGQHVVSHHFIQHRNADNVKLPPRSLLLTFNSLSAANIFNTTDTQLTYSLIKSSSKQFHQPVKIRQCTICKQTNHFKGDPRCDNLLCCPKCRRTCHTVPNDTCIATCWLHDTGHQSNSSFCSSNIAYLKQMRINLNKSKSTPQLVNSYNSNPSPQPPVLNPPFIRTNFR